MPDIVIVGASGYGIEVIDVIEAARRANNGRQYRIVGVIDDDPSQSAIAFMAGHGYPYLGDISEWISTGVHSAQYALGVRNPMARRSLAQRLDIAGLQAASSLIHPSSVIGSMFRSLDGGIVFPGVQVSTNVRLGRHVQLGANSIIGHDAEIGDYVSVCPGGIVSGEVVLRGLSLIGSRAVILQGLTIGERGIVSAAACVTKDAPAGSRMSGIPAKAF